MEGGQRAGRLPRRRRSGPTAVATTELSTTTPKERVWKSRRISSRAKKTPAIGALKVARDAAGGAAGDQQAQVSAPASRLSCPSAEPIAEPIWTIGPSRPTEPPEPMQSAEASDLTIGTAAADPALVAVDGEHHLGDAVAARLGGEAVDQRAVEQPADDRDDEDHEGPEERHVRVGEVPERAGVAVAAEELGEAEDQVAEADRAEAGADADQQRQPTSSPPSPPRLERRPPVAAPRR